jgi:hypothetical protein
LSHLSLQSVSGAFALIAGVAVVIAMVAGPGDVEAVPEPTSASIPDNAIVEVVPPSIEGVDPAVQRVLYASGKAEVLRADQLSDLPPEVARVLVYFGATLAIPTAPAGGQ